MSTEVLGEIPTSPKLSEVRRGLEKDFIHTAGEIHTPQEYNTRAAGYSVSRSRFLVAPQNADVSTLDEMGLFADTVLTETGVTRWNKDPRVYDSVIGKRVLYGRLYAGEPIQSVSEGGVTLEEHARSIEVVIMPDAILADVAFRVSQEKLKGDFNPPNLELALVTESVPIEVFQAGSGSLREYAAGLERALTAYQGAQHV